MSDLNNNDLADQLMRGESEVARLFKSAAIDFGVKSQLAQAMKAITDQGEVIDSLGVSAFVQSELANARALSSAMFTVPDSVLSTISGMNEMMEQTALVQIASSVGYIGLSES